MEKESQGTLSKQRETHDSPAARGGTWLETYEEKEEEIHSAKAQGEEEIMPDEELPKLMTASDKEIWARFAIALIPFHTRREPTYEQHEFIDMDGLYGTADLMFNEMQRRCEGVEAAYGLGGKGE